MWEQLSSNLQCLLIEEVLQNGLIVYLCLEIAGMFLEMLKERTDRNVTTRNTVYT